MQKKESIVDYLSKTKGTPVKISKQEARRQDNILDYYGFGKKDVEKALEQAVTELSEEVREDTGQPPKAATKIRSEPAGPDLRQLVDEIKSALRQGVAEQAKPDTGFQDAMLGELRKLRNKQTPAPIVEVTTPEQKVTPPIKKVIATNIERDVNGNVAGAEFIVER